MRKALTFSLLLVAILGALLVVLFSATVYTYHRLTAEALIAELRFEAAGERQYLAYLRTGDRCEERVLPVFGDQWRVDAEFLKWKYWAMLFGLDSQYRLDRLEGRYRSVTEQNSRPNVAHDLGDGTAIDIVAVAGALGSWNFLVDATYGTSTYEDIDVANAYYVYRTTTGIITRFEPRPMQLERGKPLEIDIDAACGGEPSAWQRLAAWTNERAVALRDLVER
jgi:hypothetical protein